MPRRLLTQRKKSSMCLRFPVFRAVQQPLAYLILRLAAPAYWNHHVYVFADNDVLKEFTLRDGRLELTSKLNGGPLEPGATPTISANGNKDGIVWTISGRTWEIIPEKIALLHAFDASHVARA